MKKYIALLLTVVLFAGLCGCANRISMPFNGTVEFNRISLTVPTRFVRDSTQSNEDLWIFEHGNYMNTSFFPVRILQGMRRLPFKAMWRI